MNDGMLSQEEIDALLNGSFDETDEKEDKVNHNNEIDEEILSSFEKDALGEIGNISFGSSATALSTLLNQKVEITTPKVTIIKKDQLEDEFPKPYVAISVDYITGFSGRNLLVIKQSDASIIADLMLGGTGENVNEEINDLQLSAVQEAMNQMMGNAATSMSTVFQKRVDISPPTLDLLNLPEGKGTEQLPDDDYIVKVSFSLKVGELINSSIMQLFTIPFAKQLVNDLVDSTQNEATSTVLEEKEVEVIHDEGNEMANYKKDLNQEEKQNTIQSDVGQGQYTHQPNQMDYFQERTVQNQPKQQPVKNVQPAKFADFGTASTPTETPRNLNMLFDIPLQVTVELGRTAKVVKEILELSPGSIIELDKLAGEPVDILVNNKLIAKGEVVVIDENFGVRITDILSQQERIKNMN